MVIRSLYWKGFNRRCALKPRPIPLFVVVFQEHSSLLSNLIVVLLRVVEFPMKQCRNRQKNPA